MITVRLAVDIGGTFTDIVLDHEGRQTSAKVLTTADAPERGFLEGALRVLRDAGVAPRSITSLIHGTTLATNALIEREGAWCALVTTEGFRDSLEIGYEARFDQYDLDLEKSSPLIPRHMRFCVRERISAEGGVLVDLDEAAVRALAGELRRAGPESIAVGFLHAYANPAHERRAGEILAEELPSIPISLSSEVCPEIREYERLSTTVANAYVRPKMASYLRSLDRELTGAGFECPLFLVTSAGGITTLDTAMQFPIRLVESGPSGGAVLAEITAEQRGEEAVLSYDMGGTTAKICLIDHYRASRAREFEAARSARFAKGSGIPLRIPVVEMIEIGAGGGSIASVDALNRIAVGPHSAGSDPGPACYGRGGTLATVTDADLALGRLDPDRFAEGRLPLDKAATQNALAESIAGPLDLDDMGAAQGICEMVDEAMANAARVHAVEHAADLRDFTLIAFGGAGPLHAGRLAEKLGIERLIVPRNPGVGSAVGFLSMPVSYELVRSRYMTLSRFEPQAANEVLDGLLCEARSVVARAAPGAALSERRSVLMRYLGQGHEVEVELPVGSLDNGSADELRERYGARYAALYGRQLPDGEIEILTWAVTVASPRKSVERSGNQVKPDLEAVPIGQRHVFDTGAGACFEGPVYLRADLSPGLEFEGPALVVEAQTTTVVPASFKAEVDEFDNLVLVRKKSAPLPGRLESLRDPKDIQLQVMWNRLQAVVDEQAGVLMRTAFSPIVRESGDLSAGVFDAAGRMLAQAVTGTPGHVNTMASACQKFFETFPPREMRDGDIYLTNDPWLGAGHLNDFVLLKPCFHRDRLVGFVSCTSHLVDIGGRCLGPDGSDVYDEGLYVPPLRLVDRDAPNATFMTLLKANSRSPVQAEGDVFALIACCEIGERRLLEMILDFALVDLVPLSQRILETSEQATRDRIRALPDGRYSYEMTVDGYEEAITLKAILDICGDGLLLNFHESAPPSKHGINVPLNYTEAYAAFGLKCVIAPDIPNNHGSLAALRVTASEGSILNARKPAPVCSRHILGQLLPDVAMGCLYQVVPERVPAEGAATLWDLPMKGSRTSDGRSFAAELVHNGGTGARHGKDGLSATAFPSGVMGSLVEITESTTPIIVRRRELRMDSGGAGRTRGGLGQVIELEAVKSAPLTIYGTVDRVRYPALARRGGQAGVCGAFEHSSGEPFHGKGACLLEPGQRLRVLTPGGGGYGSPLERHPDRVAEDLRNSLISAESAKTVYGVSVLPDGAVDEVDTRRLRKELRKEA
jgi:N-methylhydantoinase A/oxoprolinase/acetone carboxylase beta subunit/N-methylhydantoinase B/oxoprolinase/acetone carboxylase alpha subunit